MASHSLTLLSVSYPHLRRQGALYRSLPISTIQQYRRRCFVECLHEKPHMLTTLVLLEAGGRVVPNYCELLYGVYTQR